MPFSSTIQVRIEALNSTIGGEFSQMHTPDSKTFCVFSEVTEVEAKVLPGTVQA